MSTTFRRTRSGLYYPRGTPYDLALAAMVPHIDLWMDETSGTTLVDSLGHSNGSFTAGATLGAAGLVNDGHSGTCLRTTGSSQFVSIPGVLGSALGVCNWWNFWFKFGSAGSAFSTPIWGSSGSSNFWSLNAGGSNARVILVALTSSGGQAVAAPEQTLMLNGATHMLTFQFVDATDECKFWIDGVLKYTWTRAGINLGNGTNPLVLGKYNNVTQYSYNWWDRFSYGRAQVITDAQVAALYAAGL